MSQPPSLPQGSPPSPPLLNIENQQADGHAENTSENASIRIFENGAWRYNEALQSLNERQIDEPSEEEQAAARVYAAYLRLEFEGSVSSACYFSDYIGVTQSEESEELEETAPETLGEAETGAGAGVEAEVKVDVGIEAGAGAEAEVKVDVGIGAEVEAEIELKAETAEELVVRPKEKTDKNKRKKEKKKEKKKELEKKEKMKPSADDELLDKFIKENQLLLQKSAAALGAEVAVSSTPMPVSSGQAVPEGSTLSPIIYFFNDPTYKQEYLFLEAKFVGGLNSIIIALQQKKNIQLRLGVKVIKESRLKILQAFKYIEKKMATALFFEQNTALDDELGLRFLGFARQIQNHYQQKIAPKLPLFLNINTGNEIDIIDMTLFGSEVDKYNERNLALLKLTRDEINRYNKNKQ